MKYLQHPAPFPLTENHSYLWLFLGYNGIIITPHLKLLDAYLTWHVQFIICFSRDVLNVLFCTGSDIG